MSEAPYREKWVSDCGAVTLYCGDCLEVLPTLEAGSVDAVVTDPPYGVDYKGKTTKHTRRNGGCYENGDSDFVGPEFMRRWKGRAVVYPGTRIAFDYPKPVEIGFAFCPSGAGLGKWGFITGHPILYYGSDPYLQNGLGHRPNGFTSFSTQPPNGHPCPKPIEWMLFAVSKASCDAGDVIFDPFMGSGTTGVACVRLGRRFIGIELEPKYFAIAKRRIIDELNRVKFLKPPKREVQRTLLEASGK